MPDSLDVLLAKRFIERRDVKAVQHPGGAYTPERTPWKMGDIRSHIAGEKTFGHYMVGTDDKVKLFAFDIDLKKLGYWISTEEDTLMNGGQPCNPREIWHGDNEDAKRFLTIQLRCLAEGLALRANRLAGGAFPVAIAYSGNKGLHVYGFTGELPAEEARALAIEILESFHCFEPTRGHNFWVHSHGQYKNLEIEVFPKQDSLEGKDLGNLMRLPLGVNRKSGQKGFFVDTRCGNDQLKEMNPLEALNGEYPWGD